MKFLVCAVAFALAQGVPVTLEVGVFADTDFGIVAMKNEITGGQVAGINQTTTGDRSLSFPIGAVDDFPVAARITQVLINLPTVQDAQASRAQLRFIVGDHEREPDFALMTTRVGKIRTGYYQVTSPNLTREWLAAAYAKMLKKSKFKDKQPAAMVGLVLSHSMYPIRLEPSMLTAK